MQKETGNVVSSSQYRNVPFQAKICPFKFSTSFKLSHLKNNGKHCLTRSKLILFMIKFYEISRKSPLNINYKKVDFIQTSSESNKSCSPKASHSSSTNMHSHFELSAFFPLQFLFNSPLRSKPVHIYSEELLLREAASGQLQSQNLK